MKCIPVIDSFTDKVKGHMVRVFIDKDQQKIQSRYVLSKDSLVKVHDAKGLLKYALGKVVNDVFQEALADQKGDYCTYLVTIQREENLMLQGTELTVTAIQVFEEEV